MTLLKHRDLSHTHNHQHIGVKKTFGSQINVDFVNKNTFASSLWKENLHIFHPRGWHFWPTTGPEASPAVIGALLSVKLTWTGTPCAHLYPTSYLSHTYTLTWRQHVFKPLYLTSSFVQLQRCCFTTRKKEKTWLLCFIHSLPLKYPTYINTFSKNEGDCSTCRYPNIITWLFGIFVEDDLTPLVPIPLIFHVSWRHHNFIQQCLRHL